MRDTRFRGVPTDAYTMVPQQLPIQRSVWIAAIAHASDSQAGHHPGQGKASHLIPPHCRPQLMRPRCVGLKAEWMGRWGLAMSTWYYAYVVHRAGKA
jgi:hypothetical protein